MNPKQKLQLTASLFRMLMYMQLMQYEFEYLSGFSFSAGIKNTLALGKRAYNNLLNSLRGQLPNSAAQINEFTIGSEEKARAIGNIIEKLHLLDETDVLRLETDFNDLIKVKY